MLCLSLSLSLSLALARSLSILARSLSILSILSLDTLTHSLTLDTLGLSRSLSVSFPPLSPPDYFRIHFTCNESFERASTVLCETETERELQERASSERERESFKSASREGASRERASSELQERELRTRER